MSSDSVPDEPVRGDSVEKMETEAENDERLKSEETLDRSSPDLWPEKVPGLKEFIQYYKTTDNRSAWAKDFTVDDVTLLHELSSLIPRNLILEVKRLHDIGYQLGVEEAREITRAKFLNIFKRNSDKAERS